MITLKFCGQLAKAVSARWVSAKSQVKNVERNQKVKTKSVTMFSADNSFFNSIIILLTMNAIKYHNLYQLYSVSILGCNNFKSNRSGLNQRKSLYFYYKWTFKHAPLFLLIITIITKIIVDSRFRYYVCSVKLLNL